jgi:hypothetical protein
LVSACSENRGTSIRDMPRWNLLAIGNKRVAPERQIVFPAGDLPNSSDHANGNSRTAISPVGTSRHFAAMLNLVSIEA